MTDEQFTQAYMLQLNPQQREAVQTVDGAILLLAVPGSGKTTVLITRLGYMVCCRGLDPASILTMTYTVAATKEMKQRFTALFGSEYADRMQFRTINGVSAKIIDYYSRNISRRPAFELLTEEGELAHILGDLYRELNGEYATESTLRDILTGITCIKNRMLTDAEIEKFDNGIDHMAELYHRYCEELLRRNRMDYDDQMVYALKILQTQPAVRAYFQSKYAYLCVDEAQDTSKIQHEILRLLAQKRNNLFMVGDEDQSIYGFRAAYPEALLRFEETYPNARVLFIEQNYRSSEEIVQAANAFVVKNRFRREKAIVPTRGTHCPVRLIYTSSREAQFKYLFTEAQRCQSETAVLYRNNDSALPLIDLLERSGIPYRCRQFDGTFFSHRLVCDVTDIIAFAQNPCDADIFLRIYYKLNAPIPKKAAVSACERSRNTGMPILNALLEDRELSAFTRERVQGLLVDLPEMTAAAAVRALELIWGALGYGSYAESRKLDANKFSVLCLLAEQVGTAPELTERLSQLRDITRTHENPGDAPFILSTIHSAKGLEFERVFLLDVLDGILPYAPRPNPTDTETINLYEEERRLFYVGMTRAKKELFLFRCFSGKTAFVDEVTENLPRELVPEDSVLALLRPKLCGRSYEHRQHGKGRVLAQQEDTVLVEYEGGLLQLMAVSELLENRSVVYGANTANSPKEGSIPPRRQVPVGAGVQHNRFGHGCIVRYDAETDQVTIRFDRYGEKKFIYTIAVEKGFLHF